ncbi:hypothetical protein ACHQM5_026475 [Ranunculus cassubicifolius]
MAEGTRWQHLEQQIQGTVSRFEEIDNHQHLVEAEVKSLRGSVDGFQTQVNLMDKRIQSILDGQERLERLHLQSLKTGSATQGAESSAGLFPRPVTDRPLSVTSDPTPLSAPGGGNYKTPRVEFPTFDGSQVRVWIQKANRFFQLNPMGDHQKILLASLYFKGKAENWFQTDTAGFEKLQWSEFTEKLKFRFYEDTSENVVAEFNRLSQTSSVQQYLDRFEELYPLMLLRNKGLTESFFVDCFIGGLKEEIRHTVLMFKPITLHHAVSLARLQEATMDSLEKPKRGNYSHFKSSYSFSSPQRLSSTNSPSVLGANKPTSTPLLESGSPKPLSLPPIKRLSPAEMQLRKDKGLCYNCDETYVLGHKCKTKQLFLIVGDDEETDVTTTPPAADGVQPIHGSDPCPNPSVVAISLQALSGTNSFQTIQLQGTIRHKQINMLVDSGSTHNFLDAETARQLGCECRVTSSHEVTVAGGGKLQCDTYCPNFQWEINGVQFQSDVRILPLGGCDLVLGVQWLKTIGPVLMDFDKLQMSFTYQGNQLTLQGNQTTKQIQFMSMSAIQKYVQNNPNGVWGVLFAVATTDRIPEHIPPEIAAVLEEFAEVFQEPHSLPPSRSHDHRIVLKPEATPIAARPYRYPQIQKSEIERQIQNLLADGFIQSSQSPFSSPVLLVKKRDSSWRMCIDYRRLNDSTIKHPFPIPMIDELLDELHGATVFSKLDLKAGYHQIRVAEADIEKTAFSTHAGHYEFKVMPFGLTNAPATFQGLMNDIFKVQMRKSVLVFFNDILIFSPSLQAHILHLRETFTILKNNQLKVNQQKCQFARSELEYLGHVISASGISADPMKISAIQSWPQPSTVRGLRGFLGLTGYYRRFIRHYGSVAKPLTALLKKDNFVWTPDAIQAFADLKQAMIRVPTLACPDFSKPFCVETDACQSGVGAVLLQNEQPLAFISKALPPSKLGLSAYEKELWALIYAVSKWRYYLLGRKFQIRTDHQSLKYLLEQRITTILQQKWLTKLLGFDFDIIYKKGSLNIPADSLSRVFEEGGQCSAISVVQPIWMQDLKASWENDEMAQGLIAGLLIAPTSASEYTYVNQLLRYKGKLFVGNCQNLRYQLWQEMHCSAFGGHSGTTVTLKRLLNFFYWPSIRKDVKQWTASCTVCQENKYERVPTPGLLQPLPIPSEAWQAITMDFVEGLPMSGGKNVILVVVDRFSRYAHFLLLKHPFSASTVAALFVDHIFKLHGLPQSIISDRGSVFISQFWAKVFELLGTKLLHSTSYHPQTDGLTERVNQCLETYLRCMSSANPTKWASWIPLAEWWYNTSYHSALQSTPFQVLYGYTPKVHVFPQQPQSGIPEVDTFLRERSQALQVIKDNLHQAQARMKQYSDKHRSEREFAVGDQVYLRLQPYRQSSVALRRNLKLSPRFYGPYRILERIGKVAYRLELPPEASIHPTFHVSQLKKQVSLNTTPQSQLPAFSSDGSLPVWPVTVLNYRQIKRRRAPISQVLVQWSPGGGKDQTWEDTSDMASRFPSLDLGDKVNP